MARNLTILYENAADRATLSGGGWLPGMGLINLTTPYFSEVARSRSTAIADTRFTVRLRSPVLIGGIALGPMNATPLAVVRFQAFGDEALKTLLYDSGFLKLNGEPQSSLNFEWEDEGFWSGYFEDFDDQTKGPTLIHVPLSVVGAQYLTVEIQDPSNPAGYLDIGRLFVGRGWTPEVNYSLDGNSLDFETLTDEEESRSGVKFYNPRAIRRVFSFAFNYLNDLSNFQDIYRIATRSGRHNQVVIIPNPDDAVSYQREAFIGTLRQLPSLRRSSYAGISTSYVIEESL